MRMGFSNEVLIDTICVGKGPVRSRDSLWLCSLVVLGGVRNASSGSGMRLGWCSFVVQDRPAALYGND